MNQHTGNRRPWHLWLVAIVSILWNAGGAFDYLATKLRLEFYMQNFSPEQLDYFYNYPAWMTVFWALGVWGALLGSLALLLGSRWAVTLFAVSLLGMVVSMGWMLLFSGASALMGTGERIFSLAIVVIGIALFVYARSMRRRGALR